MATKTPKPYTEASIANQLVRSLFKNAVLAIPNCSWTGSECDLLVVDKKSLRIIDVEIKISLADLKRDLAKDKWWVPRPWSRRRHAIPLRREWPAHVWKHYYVMPACVWDDKLIPELPLASGIITLDERHRINVIRIAKPNSKATPISPADAIDLARLAGLRMWAALTKEQP